MARKNLLESVLGPDGEKSDSSTRSNYALKGASGKMKASLDSLADDAKKMLEGETIVEIEPDKIDVSFVNDRLAGDEEEYLSLKSAIERVGQDTPVLLRPHPDKADRYMIVFGHRRVRVARELGQPVRAVIKPMDDLAHILAQGQENSARSDLSFIEKALFARRLMELGHPKDVVQAALTVDSTLLSRLLSVSQKIDEIIIEFIGSAKSIGRDRWEAFKKLVVLPTNKKKVLDLIAEQSMQDLTSDERFEELLKALQKARSAPKKKPASQSTTRKLGEIGSLTVAPNSIKISLSKAHGEGFQKFLEAEMDSLVSKYRRGLEDN